MKILIIGLGSIALKHINALRKNFTNAEIFALRSSLHSNNIASVNNIYDFEKLSEIKWSFIIISNPTNLHKSTIEQCLKLNAPLFIEKPIFDSIENCDELIKQCKHKITYVACNLRFLDSLIFAKKMIEEKRINEVNVYCGSYLPDWRPGKDFRKIYSANIKQGGGVHIDLIHEIDYIYWLFKTPNQIQKTFQSKSSLNITAYDYANYLFEYDNFAVNIILNYYRRDSKRTLEIVCEDGTLLVDLLNNKTYWNNQLIFESEKRIIDTYDDQMLFFINHILTLEKPNFNSIQEAYNVLKLCLKEN